MNLEESIAWGVDMLWLVSSAAVFFWTSMAWQRHQHRAFLLWALASALTLLIGVMSLLATHRSLSQDDYAKYWYCNRLATAVDSALYMWAAYEILKLFRELYLTLPAQSKTPSESEQ